MIRTSVERRRRD